MKASPDEMRAWVEQWRAAAPALARQHELELRTLTAAQALAASHALLSLADPTRLSPKRWNSSGLVEQQSILNRERP